METKQMMKLLSGIASEMSMAFDSWDRHIANGFQAVPIQDLDFWRKTIMQVISEQKSEQEKQEVETKQTIQVVWKAYTNKHNAVGGVAEFDSLDAIKEWNECESVRFGEDGGIFFMEGFWYGSFQDLQDGSAIFHSAKLLEKVLAGTLNYDIEQALAKARKSIEVKQ